MVAVAAVVVAVLSITAWSGHLNWLTCTCCDNGIVKILVRIAAYVAGGAWCA